MSSDARWPTAVDYQTALQMPALSFSDAALKRGVATKDALGLPQAATGNVAAVFRMRLPRGDVAIRCFTRPAPFALLEKRYQALRHHLDRVSVPALASCAYRPDELQVADGRYPVVLMEWVDGMHLHRFVAEHAGQADVLHALADQWRILMIQLRAVRLAHGDLADGNILVDGKGRMRLIDYDAAYVPALADQPPAEIGKPHYQHPDRLRPDGPGYGYYAENVDAFAALVVYLSLRAVADDPTRWDRYHMGENLLFTQSDYERPGATPIWDDMHAAADAEVRGLAEALEAYCRSTVARLPHLEEVLQGQTLCSLDGRPQGIATETVPEDAAALRRAPQAPDRPAVQKAAAGRRARWPRRRTAGLAMAACVALAAFLGVPRLVQPPADPPSSSAAAPSPEAASSSTALTLEDLAGFYTGYATSLDGTRETMALTIEPPDTSYADSTARFPYSINWQSHQASGVGAYDAGTGYLDLSDHYELYVVPAGEEEIVLASPRHQEDGPLVKVYKRRTP